MLSIVLELSGMDTKDAGRKGGKRRARNLTAEQRSKIARKGV